MKTPVRYEIPGGLGLLALILYFGLNAVFNAPRTVERFESREVAKTEQQQALDAINREAELAKARQEAGLIKEYESLILIGYIQDPNYPPQQDLSLLYGPDEFVRIYDRQQTCIGTFTEGAFFWVGQYPDACNMPKPIK